MFHVNGKLCAMGSNLIKYKDVKQPFHPELHLLPWKLTTEQSLPFYIQEQLEAEIFLSENTIAVVNHSIESYTLELQAIICNLSHTKAI